MPGRDGDSPLHRHRLDVLVITVLIETELKAALGAFGLDPTSTPDVRTRDEATWFAEVPGTDNRPLKIGITAIGQPGIADASAVTAVLAERYDPDLLIMAGIGAGLRNKVGLGDVVVGEAILGYETVKRLPGQVERRYQQLRTSQRILNTVRYWDGGAGKAAWKKKIVNSWPQFFPTSVAPDPLPRMPTSHFGIIASGDKLIEDGSLSGLHAEEPQVRAADMESIGFAKAAERWERRFLVVRGISDFGDQDSRSGNEKDRYHMAAAVSALTYVAEYVKNGYIPGDSRQGGTSDDGGGGATDEIAAKTDKPSKGTSRGKKGRGWTGFFSLTPDSDRTPAWTGEWGGGRVFEAGKPPISREKWCYDEPFRSETATGKYSMTQVHHLEWVESNHEYTKFTHSIEKLARNGKRIALMHVDLDQFGRFTRRYGVSKGNRVLKDVRKALQETVPPSSICFSPGADDIFLAVGLDEEWEALQLGEKLRQSVRRIGRDHGTGLTASVGIATIFSDSDIADKLHYYALAATDLAKSTKGETQIGRGNRLAAITLYGSTREETLRARCVTLDAKESKRIGKGTTINQKEFALPVNTLGAIHG